MDVAGLLLIDKPTGWTSFDVVAKTRGVIKRSVGRKVKVGHAGTLDPMATGLLILAIGKATKRIESLMKLDKQYEAQITLGARSTTDDAEGELSVVQSPLNLDEATIREAITSFQGGYEQMPPQFSAIKVKGQRAYKLARKGQEVSLKSRPVKIDITDIAVDMPRVSFTVDVSSGTYIRSLARDIGEKLETGAYLSALRRTQIGDFNVQRAVGMEELNMERIQEHLISP